MFAALVPPFETGTGMLPRKRFTRDEVDRLSADGYFEGQRTHRRRPSRQDGTESPGDELLLVIEVSDTTAPFDLSRKAALYAAAGVPEYWVLDLGRRMLVAHRQPEGTLYRLVQLLTDRDTASIENRPETLRGGRHTARCLTVLTLHTCGVPDRC